MSGSLLTKVEAGAALESAEAEALMEEVLGGRMDTPAIVRLLTALNAAIAAGTIMLRTAHNPASSERNFAA